MTKAQWREALRGRVGNSVFWTDGQLDRAIQGTLRVWNLLTGYWTTRAVLEVSGGVSRYLLPTTRALLTRLEYRGNGLWPVSRWELDHSFPTWMGWAAGTPRYWIPDGLTAVVLAPAPVSSGLDLLVDGLSATPVLVAEGDTLDAEDSLVEVLLEGARYRCYLSLGTSVFHSAALGGYQTLLKAAGEHNRRLTTLTAYKALLGTNRDQASDRPPRQPAAVTEEGA